MGVTMIASSGNDWKDNTLFLIPQRRQTLMVAVLAERCTIEQLTTKKTRAVPWSFC
jgi:hypothetical protein